MTDNMEAFLHHHGIRILDTNKRAHRYHKINVNYFTNPMNYNEIYKDIEYDTEPLYTVEVSESELTRIAEFESRVFNHMKKHGHYDMFNILMEQKEKERYLKEKYPAVKKAYEQYSLMLKLAESGEL